MVLTAGQAKLIGLVGAAALLFLAIAPLGQHEQLVGALNWIDGLEMWGPLALTGIYIVACVVLLPGLVLSLGAGFCFGLLIGTAVVSVGSTIGACVAFVIGRRIARRWVETAFVQRSRLRALDAAVDREGFKIVLLLRMSPIFPFVVLNYVLGLTRISLRRYAVASWIGMMPVTVMYVYLGSVARSLSDIAAGRAESSPWQGPLLWAGLVVTVVVTFLLARIAKRALAEAIPHEQQAVSE